MDETAKNEKPAKEDANNASQKTPTANPGPPVDKRNEIGHEQDQEEAKDDTNDSQKNTGDMTGKEGILSRFFSWFRKEAKLTDWIVALFTVGLFLIAVVQGIAMFLQYCEMRNAGRQTDRTISILESEERPWVGVVASCVIPKEQFDYRAQIDPKTRCKAHPEDFLEHLSPKDWVKILITVGNTGNSVALHVAFSANWCVSEKMDDNPPSLKECADGQMIRGQGPLFPHAGDDSMTGLEDNFRLNAAQVESLGSKIGHFYLVGKVIYDENIEGSSHETNFCLTNAPRKYVPYWHYCMAGNNGK